MGNSFIFIILISQIAFNSKFIKIFNMRILPILILFLISINTDLFGQKEFGFMKLNFGSDPSRNSSVCIKQDSKGFLWFGTKFGLVKYDGYESKSFIYNHKDSTSISGNFIRDICEDSNSNLWIAADTRGISKYVRNENNFRQIDLKKFFPDKVEINRVWAIQIQHYKNSEILWIGTSEGLIKTDLNFNSLQLFTKNNSNLPANFISDLQLYNDSLWVGTEKGIALGANGSITNLSHSFLKDITSFIWNIQSDDRKIYIGTQGNGLFLFDKKDNKLTNFTSSNSGLSDNRVLQILIDNNKVWLATWGGLNTYNKLTNSIQWNKLKELDKSFLSFCLDNSGIMWMGTEYHGVFFHYPEINKFKSLKIKNDYQGTIKDLCNLDSNVFIAATTGLLKLSNLMDGTPKLQIINSFVKYNIQSVTPLKNSLLVGTFWNGVLWIDSNYNIKKSRLPGKSITDILINNAGEIYVSTLRSGVYLFDNNFNLIDSLNTRNGKVFSNNTHILFKDNQNNIWIGTSNGIVVLDNTNDAKLIIQSSSEGLSSGNISCITQLENYIWIGTLGGGVGRYNLSDNTFTTFSENNGLAGANVESIITDKEGFIWVGTTNGLSKINPHTSQIINYSVDDGLLSNEFSKGALLINNRILLSNNKGISYFTPDSLKQNKFIPPIEISEILSGGKYILPKQIGNSEYRIILDENQNSFTIKAAALNFIFPERNQYSYWLSEIDNSWSLPTTNREIRYTNLSPADYQLMIRASNNDGLWNTEPIKLNIEINSPFWLTLWFRISIIILLIILLSIIIFFRFRHILEIERLRVKIARDLHDEIGSSLTKLTMNAGLLEYERDEKKLKERTNKLQTMSREVISMMSDIVWSIDSRNDTLQDLADRINNNAASFRESTDKKINTKINLLHPSRKISLRKKENIYFIFKEALHNAIKHSKSKEIKIELSELSDELILTVEDTGKGFITGDSSPGNGIRNMKTRSEEIKGNIKITSESNYTIVKFTVGIP